VSNAENVNGPGDSPGALDHYIEAEDFRARRPSFEAAKKVMKDLASEKQPFSFGIALVVLGTAASLYEPRLFGRAIDQAIIPKDLDLLAKMTVVYFSLIFIRIVSSIGQQYAFEILAQRLMQRIRLRVFSLYQRLPIQTYDRTPVGRLITRLTNDTSSMSEMFSSGFVTFFGNLLFIAGSIAWIFYLNWRLAIVALAIFPLLVFFSVKFSGISGRLPNRADADFGAECISRRKYPRHENRTPV